MILELEVAAIERLYTVVLINPKGPVLVDVGLKFVNLKLEVDNVIVEQASD